MVVMRNVLRALLGGRDRRIVVYECRRCGTTVDAEEDPCPYCGPTDIMVYEID